MRKLRFLFASFLFVSISSCATPPKSLQVEVRESIRKIGIVASPKDNKLQVLDHTGTWDQTCGGMQYGAVGGALEAAILGAQAKVRINKSLGGDPDLLRAEVGKLPVEDLIEVRLKERLSKNHDVIESSVIKAALAKRSPAGGLRTEELLAACNELGLDALVRIEFVYGLAAYVGEPASAAVDANLAIWDVRSGKSLFKKTIQSDPLFKSSHTMSEFTKDSGSLFKEDMERAADSVSLQVATFFAMDLDEEKNRRVDDVLSTLFVTCNRPYKLTQDCSGFSGATRTIRIKDQNLKIAGSADGRVILVMGDKPILNALADGLTLGIGAFSTDAVSRSLKAVTSFLSEKNIKILRQEFKTSHGRKYHNNNEINGLLSNFL